MLTIEEMQDKITGLECEISELVNTLYPKSNDSTKEWIKLNFERYLKDGQTTL